MISDIDLRIMALDIGEKRVGIAISDGRQTVASAIEILPAADVFSSSRKFRSVVERWEPGMLLFGLARSLSGKEESQAQRIRTIAENVAKSCDLPYEFYDERLSSREAKVYMREAGMSEREMRGKIDSVAAQIFLQSYLDSKRDNRD